MFIQEFAGEKSDPFAYFQFSRQFLHQRTIAMVQLIRN